MIEATLQHVSVDKIEPDPNQPRKTTNEAEFADLVQSVKTRGVLQPLRLRPNGSGDTFVIVAGERRWRAAREAGLETVPASIADGNDAGALVVDALVENLVREDLNPIEEGDAYAAMHTSGMTYEGIAREVSRPEARIRDRIGLAQLPPTARAAAAAGSVPLAKLRELVSLAQQSPVLSEAVAMSLDAGGWRDSPWHAFVDLDRRDPSVKTVECEKCEGEGWLEDGECDACNGNGSIVSKVKGGRSYPEFFAIAFWNFSPLFDRMLPQLTKEARSAIEAQRKRAADHEEAKRERLGYGSMQPPLPAFSPRDDALIDAARAAGVLVEIDGTSRVVCVDAAWASEYLPAAYEAAVDGYVNPPRGGAKKSSAGNGKRELTAAEQKEADKRKTERDNAKNMRVVGREYNTRLGAAIQQNLGEVPFTLDAAKLTVRTLLDVAKRSTYQHDAAGEGHVMFHRFTDETLEVKKNGSVVYPRRGDAAEYAKGVFAKAEREVTQAKTIDQAFAVWVRFLAHGLADVGGMVRADTEFTSGFSVQGGKWKAFVLSKLPAASKRAAGKRGGDGWKAL